MLQEGIFYQPKTSPGKYLCIVFIGLDKTKDYSYHRNELNSLWDITQQLKKGIISDLPNEKFPAMELSVTMGYGKNFFDISGLKKAAPYELLNYGSFQQPKATGGGRLLIGSGLNYSKSISKNMATEDVVFQFTGNSELSVNRSIVEFWKYFNDTNSESYISSFHKGFQREDRRSWIDFHDGISNLKSGQERLDALQIKKTIGEDSWTEGGSYLTFLKTSVNLIEWRNLNNSEQELLVGRKKASGCPIQFFENDKSVVVKGCPVTGSQTIVDIVEGKLINEQFIEPPSNIDDTLRMSHVQRVNQHRNPASSRDSLKIFRQGYEFLEPINKEPGFVAGLNFISFQDTPERIQRILTQPTWMGNTNFGGKEQDIEGSKSILEVLASGIYLIPPFMQDEKFPGEHIFMENII